MAEAANRSSSQSPDDVLSWNDYFMALAVLSAKRSKDRECKVGAVIVDTNLRVVGLGYNGLPDGRDDNEFWKNVNNDEIKKYYACHAEMNAILNTKNAKGCTMYVTRFPCHECAKLIIQSGIVKYYYLTKKGNASEKCAVKILENVLHDPESTNDKKVKGHKVIGEEYVPDKQEIIINFEEFARANLPPTN